MRYNRGQRFEEDFFQVSRSRGEGAVLILTRAHLISVCCHASNGLPHIDGSVLPRND